MKLNQFIPTFYYKYQFNKGLKRFLASGHNDPKIYQTMIKLFCRSNGASNDLYHDKLKKTKKPNSGDRFSGVLGNLDRSELTNITREMNEEGYVVFSQSLSGDKIKALTEFARKTAAITHHSKENIFFDENNIQSEIYRIPIPDMMNDPLIQDLIIDESIVNMAREYLNCEPIFDFPAMWWSTPFLKEASAEAAQLYHFDMDRLKWIKFFFYLNDVGDENGPHCYISHSHKTGAKPNHILQRGYARILDTELQPYYPASDFKVLKGKAGSMFAGDTKCWHKGKPLSEGYRLVFELEYTSSLFGNPIDKLTVTKPTEAFKNYCLMNPHFASNIIIPNNS